MWRYLVGAIGALLLAGAAVLMFRGTAAPQKPLPAMPAAPAAASAEEPLPDDVPEATARTREQKRFDRYDKDRDGKITLTEYLLARHKAFAKLDTNHDGVLQFDEWAAKTEAKFATADANHDNSLTPTEFATTKVKRKTRRPRGCPPADRAAPQRDDDAGGEGQ